jgi:hypothetical protein
METGDRCAADGPAATRGRAVQAGPPQTVVPSPKSRLNQRFDKERDAGTRYEALIARRGPARGKIVPLEADQFDEASPPPVDTTLISPTGADDERRAGERRGALYRISHASCSVDVFCLARIQLQCHCLVANVFDLIELKPHRWRGTWLRLTPRQRTWPCESAEARLSAAKPLRAASVQIGFGLYEAGRVKRCFVGVCGVFIVGIERHYSHGSPQFRDGGWSSSPEAAKRGG